MPLLQSLTMISVILPTRGIVFTEVEQSIEDNLKEYNHRVYRSFTLPIPESENYLVDKALEDHPTYLLFVEEDTVLPEHAFVNMVKANADIACIDYGVSGWSCITRRKTTTEILWCGLGCTLVRREVFDKLDKPFFRTDLALRLNDWETNEKDWQEVPKEKQYGGQDIYFCCKAREKGFSIVQVDGECKHLKLKSIGQAGINSGLHVIEAKEKISKRTTL